MLGMAQKHPFGSTVPSLDTCATTAVAPARYATRFLSATKSMPLLELAVLPMTFLSARHDSSRLLLIGERDAGERENGEDRGVIFSPGLALGEAA